MLNGCIKSCINSHSCAMLTRNFIYQGETNIYKKIFYLDPNNVYPTSAELIEYHGGGGGGGGHGGGGAGAGGGNGAGGKCVAVVLFYSILSYCLVF